jgi:hypothetical protein
MRVTPTNDDMLIVERRGEGESSPDGYHSSVSDRADRVGIKTGIHFGDGRSVVEEFRATVVR